MYWDWKCGGAITHSQLNIMTSDSGKVIQVDDEFTEFTLQNHGGGLTNGYQESTTIYSASSVGYSLISSIGAQRMASQMIPTPGLNNNNNGNSSSNQSYMNMVLYGGGLVMLDVVYGGRDGLPSGLRIGAIERERVLGVIDLGEVVGDVMDGCWEVDDGLGLLMG
ncbi:hypothetical protein Tco_0493259 [Tanacetum coccineum]